jgi:hypothetical protein
LPFHARVYIYFSRRYLKTIPDLLERFLIPAELREEVWEGYLLETAALGKEARE